MKYLLNRIPGGRGAAQHVVGPEAARLALLMASKLLRC